MIRPNPFVPGIREVAVIPRHGQPLVGGFFLAGLVRRKPTLPGIVLNGFSETGMRRLVIATPLTKRFPATPHAAVPTNSRSAVSTCSHSAIAAWRPYVAVA